MDLISRKAVHDGMMKYGFIAPDMTVHEFVEDELPSVPAVPLDKLCECIAGLGHCPPDNETVIKNCDIGHCELCWKNYLIKWMEGLDGSESMVQKT